MNKKLVLDQSKLLGFKIFAKDCTKNKAGEINISDLMGAKVGKPATAGKPAKAN